MNVLFYDTETTGFRHRDRRSNDPTQPHLVQLGAALIDVDADNVGAPLALLDSIVRPDGWEIPIEASEVHKITTAIALEKGRPEGDVVQEFDALWRRAELRVAHHEDFDMRMLRIAYLRFLDQKRADEWRDGKAECTMLQSKPICRLPPTEAMLNSRFKNQFKTPKLSEAFLHFAGREMVGAHTALDDCRACFYVWRAIRRLKEAV